ncbi:MAG: DNA alkylation repair protein [Actinomycetota bacterium]
MRSSDAIDELKARADPVARAAMARFGIRGEGVLGGSPVPHLRRMARALGRDHGVAEELWSSGIHEARLLATPVDEPAKVTPAQMERWAADCDSWDLVDGACLNLFWRTPHAWDAVERWSGRRDEFVKRAAFALMAALAVRHAAAPDERFVRLLGLVEREAADARNVVRKAVNWALRQIGKRNSTLHAAAIESAERILRDGPRSARWVASHALRELRTERVSAAVGSRRQRGRPAKRAAAEGPAG